MGEDTFYGHCIKFFLNVFTIQIPTHLGWQLLGLFSFLNIGKKQK